MQLVQRLTARLRDPARVSSPLLQLHIVILIPHPILALTSFDLSQIKVREILTDIPRTIATDRGHPARLVKEEQIGAGEVLPEGNDHFRRTRSPLTSTAPGTTRIDGECSLLVQRPARVKLGPRPRATKREEREEREGRSGERECGQSISHASSIERRKERRGEMPRHSIAIGDGNALARSPRRAIPHPPLKALCNQLPLRIASPRLRSSKYESTQPHSNHFIHPLDDVMKTTVIVKIEFCANK